MAAAKPGATPASVAQLFSLAVAHHSAGRFVEARPIYESLLRQLPDQPDLLDLYGTLRHQLGDHEEAQELVGRSVARRPAAAGAWNHLGSIRRALGLGEPALAAFRRSAMLEPAAVEPWINIGIVANDRGDPKTTLHAGRRALAIRPALPEVRAQVGAALLGLGRTVEARDALLALRRSDPLRADLALHLSAALAALGEYAPALDAARAGIIAAPAVHELYPRLIGVRDPESDTGAFMRWSFFATYLRPGEARLWANRAAELYRGARFDEAVRHARRACLLQPGDQAALQNLIAAAYHRRDYTQGRRIARWSLAARPGHPDLVYALAEIELVIGDLCEAWTLYEARVERAGAMPRLGLPPRWRGPGTGEGALLVAAEQGIGDEVVFLSCLPDLLQTVAVPIVVEVDRRLVPVMVRSFPTVRVVARQYPPDAPGRRLLDYRALVRQEGLREAVLAGSLPRYFRAERSHPCGRRGYLVPEPARVADWRAVLERYRPTTLVGLVWRSARMNRFRAHFHAEILEWAPILDVPGCTFISLMPGSAEAEIGLVRDRLGVQIVELEGLDAWNDIDSLMALMASLDVVVAARTATCAFAGAVGAPTIRVAQSFYRMTNGCDLFFPNVTPVLDRFAPFDADAAARTAARLLHDWTVPS